MLKNMVFKKKKLDFEKVLLFVIFVCFSAIALFFVFYLRRGMGPDEYYHYEVSVLYSKTLTIPENTIETSVHGDITRIPMLFYWVSGRLINISNFLKVDSHLFLRFASYIYSLTTLVLVWLSSKEIIKERFLRIVPVLMLSTTMMFVFQGGVITYDALVHLFLIFSLWELILYIKYSNTKNLVLLLISALLACATKFTVIPFVVAEVIVVLYFLIKSKEGIGDIVKRHKILFGILSLSLVLNLYTYGINLIRYKSLTPECNQVMSHEYCTNNFLYRRSFEYKKAGELSRGGKRIRELLLSDERMNPYDYFFDWESKISPRLYGIFSHSSILFKRNFEFIYSLLFLTTLVFFIRYIKKTDKIIIILSVLSIVYTFTLAFGYHYMYYLKMNSLNIAMQGRYLLPILPSLYLVQIWSVGKIQSNLVRKILLFLIVVVFIVGYIYIFYQSITTGGAGWYPKLF